MTDRNQPNLPSLPQWVRATWGGWLLGIPCLIVLALIGELFGIGDAQVFVGAGIGTGVGILQGCALRPVLPGSAHWFWSCVGGLGAAFLVQDILRAATWGAIPSLQVTVALGGLIVGAWQWLLLRRQFQNTGWWTLASVLGWTLGGATSALADRLFQSRQLHGIWGALTYLGLVGLGGLLLGLITGLALARLSRTDNAPTTA